MPLMRQGWRMSAAGLGFAGLIALGVRGMAVVALPAALPPWSESADSRGVSFADARAVVPASGQPVSPVTSRLTERQSEVPLLHRAFVAFDRTLAGGMPGDEQSFGAQATGSQGPDVAQLRRAEQDVASARAALQFAQVEQTRVSEVPNASERQAAERELAAARATVLRAEADVARLSGPDPVVLDAAERKVQRAEATLLAAMAPRSMLAATSDRPSTAGMHDNPAVQSARLALQEAVSRRDFVRAGPPAWELERAQAALMTARLSVEVAAQRLEATGQADAMRSAEDARVAVLSVRSVLDEAEARLRALRAATP
jgi:hypothetical protein